MREASARTHVVRCFGADDKPAILMVPGFADDGSMFAPLAETELACRFRLVAIDLPGFGGALPLPMPTTMLALAGILCDLIDREQVQILVAHSLGSIIASLAACSPSRQHDPIP
jgi:pimeloyl-ACP methyl ester carboxylesterase